MKYKVGDKVRVRQWEAMKREFGLDSDGNIKLYPSFITGMSGHCGEVGIISKVSGIGYSMGNGGGFVWTDDMFEGYAFEYGDEIEVSSYEGVCGEGWVKRIYVGYIDGDYRPYCCVSSECDKEYEEGNTYDTGPWRFARPVQKDVIEVTLKKNGEVIDGPISEETARSLKIIK